ncbi:MAG: acyl-CoA dehydrogenase family protein [Polyangia bacterium]
MASLRSATREALYAFGHAHVRPSLLARDEEARFDRGLWLRLAGTGFFGLARDGAPQVLEAAQALAGLGHGGLDAPLGLSAAAQWIGTCLLQTFGSPEQRIRYVEEATAGGSILAVCNSEPEAGTRLRGMRSSLVAAASGEQRLTLHKSGASNLSAADVAIVSAWKYAPGAASEPRLEVFVLPATPPLVQESHVTELAGFRTGLTGSLRTPDADGAGTGLPVCSAEAQLGPDGSGPRILRLCFHLERLLIGALLLGLVDGLVDACAQHLGEREGRDSAFTQHQYVQEKLVLLYALARRIEGLWLLAEQSIRQALATDQIALSEADVRTPAPAPTPLEAALEAASPLLGVLKLTAVEDSLVAATTAYELLGYAGYQRASVAQKAHRDLLAFKMLGGTKELMKISVFRDLSARWSSASSRAPALDPGAVAAPKSL